MPDITRTQMHFDGLLVATLAVHVAEGHRTIAEFDQHFGSGGTWTFPYGSGTYVHTPTDWQEAREMVLKAVEEITDPEWFPSFPRPA